MNAEERKAKMKEWQRKYKQSHREQIALYMREYRRAHKPPPRDKEHKASLNKMYRQNANNDPELKKKVNARKYIENLIRRGALKREPCFLCGGPESESHHPNYDNTRYVIFLCKECHANIHSKY